MPRSTKSKNKRFVITDGIIKRAKPVPNKLPRGRVSTSLKNATYEMTTPRLRVLHEVAEDLNRNPTSLAKYKKCLVRKKRVAKETSWTKFLKEQYKNHPKLRSMDFKDRMGILKQRYSNQQKRLLREHKTH